MTQHTYAWLDQFKEQEAKRQQAQQIALKQERVRTDPYIICSACKTRNYTIGKSKVHDIFCYKCGENLGRILA
jgi:hypothetical protein